MRIQTVLLHSQQNTRTHTWHLSTQHTHTHKQKRVEGITIQTKKKMQQQQRKIGILTGGGDCPGLNAVIRAAALTAFRSGFGVIGIHDGYEGNLCPPNSDFHRGGGCFYNSEAGFTNSFIVHSSLPTGLYTESYVVLEHQKVTGIYSVGGTILGTTNIGHYSLPLSQEAIDKAVATYKKAIQPTP